jgi:hypothetical protein
MATLMQRSGQRFIGLMCGTTLGYVLAVLLGLVMRSWPLNAGFTTSAVIGLTLQIPYWRRMWREPEGALRHGLVGGLLLMGALWLLYFL